MGGDSILAFIVTFLVEVGLGGVGLGGVGLGTSSILLLPALMSDNCIVDLTGFGPM